MNHSVIISSISGLLQFAVACYALRLYHRFGTRRAGWSLFGAFLLLASLRVFLMAGAIDLEAKVECLQAAIGILMLGGLGIINSLLQERSRADGAQRQAQARLQTQVQEQTVELTRANGELTKVNEELRHATVRLEGEIAERTRIQKQVEKAHKEMLIVSRQAGMSEVAAGVLHNVGNVLNSLNVSATLVADRVRQSRVSNVMRVSRLLEDHTSDLGDFITRDPKGKQLPGYLSRLGRELIEEESLLLKEIEFVKTKIEHIKEVVVTQQGYGKVSGVSERVRITELVDDLLRIHAAELAEHGVQLRREYEPDLPEIVVDKHKALQILLNLTSNARHACVESGLRDRQVTIRVTNGDDRVRVAVSDNGVGIPAENVRKIFSQGFTTRKNGGHGFGLHTGALAAKELGGALLVHSAGPGQGATFTLELPLKRASNANRN